MSSESSSTGNSSSSSSGVRQKPRFQPRLSAKPVESNISSFESSQSITIKEESSSKHPSNKPYQKRDSHDRGNGTGRHNDINKTGRGRGRGRIPEPVGAAFFRGIASQGRDIPINRFPSNAFSESHSSSWASPANDTGKEADPVHVKTENASGINIKKINVLGKNAVEVQDLSMSQNRDDNGDEDDSDSNDEFMVNNRNRSASTQFNPMEPLELPIGPRESKVTFADVRDEAALEQEQALEMFLVQLPRDLRLPRHEQMTKNYEDLTKDATIKTPPGRLGKLQIMRSGKMYLTSSIDGRRYCVNAGMSCSFAQYVATVHVDKLPVTTSSSSASSAKPEPVVIKVENDMTAHGSIHMLGTVTQKMIILPDYEVGSLMPEKHHVKVDPHPSKKAFSSSSSSTAAAAIISSRPIRSESIGTEVSDTEYGDVRTAAIEHLAVDMDYNSDND